MVTRWNSDYEEVKHTNIFICDLNEALDDMLNPEKKGCDANLLAGTDGSENAKVEFMFSPKDHVLLRQYECAAEPVVHLTKFFQERKPTAHLVLFHLRARIAQMREKKFTMFADISYSDEPDLSKRHRSVTVLREDCPREKLGGQVEMMHDSIALFRETFADDLEYRCKLTCYNDLDPKELEDVERLPKDIAVAALLHPLLGGKWFCVLCSTLLVL